MVIGIDQTTDFDRSMRPFYVIFPGILAAFVAGCVLIHSDAAGLPAMTHAKLANGKPARLNLRLSLDCLPTCAVIGMDLHQAGKTIIAAYNDSGRFSVTPSDEVDFVADIKLSVERENDWLEAKVCNGSFGLLPAVWHDRLRMTTAFASRQGVPSRRFEQAAEIDYRCHLFLAPLVPTYGESDALDRLVTELTRRTIAQAKVEHPFGTKKQ